MPKYFAKVTRAQIDRAKALAADIWKEQPSLRKSEQLFRHLIVDSPIDDSPALHLEDFSEFPKIGTNNNSRYLQQRARLRASDGDYVALSYEIEDGYPEYCERQLCLGNVNWVYPSDELSNTLKLAIGCVQDRRVRHDLVQAARHQGLRYVHPYISTMHVWELAEILNNAAHLPIKVIGPTPALAAWSNNKIEFTAATAKLLGPQVVPATEAASNFAMLAKTIAKFAESNSRMGIKFPFGIGGKGNFMVDADRIRGMSLAETRDYLDHLLSGHQWPREGRVLIDVWETNVINSPSVQTWIPPASVGQPVIEGLFRQSVHGDQGTFVGSCPLLNLPSELEQKIVDASFLLTILFQTLGYVGRCSFDLILVGETLEDCRFEFVECNARWGGTSIPMTLVNRLNIGAGKTFSVQKIDVPGLEKTNLKRVLRNLGCELYDPASRRGRFVLFDPARIKSHSGIEAIAIADTTKRAEQSLSEFLKRRLTGLICLTGSTEPAENFGQETNQGAPHFGSTKSTEKFPQD